MTIRSEKYCDIPGDTRRVMTADHTDDSGRTWPKGTIYQPSSAGQAGGHQYQDIIIHGAHVTIREK
jgi:hypothetical protein